MAPVEFPHEYKAEVENYQSQLKARIIAHQVLFKRLQEHPKDAILQRKLKEFEGKILQIGLDGKKLFDRLRKEYKVCQKNGKKTLVKNCIEERRTNANNALVRARKQNIITRTIAVQSSSSEGSPSPGVITPEPKDQPLYPQQLSQETFLKSCFNLLTHDALQDMQHRRVERKRRSTTNPLYVYTKEWNATTLPGNTKRKRASPPSSIAPIRCSRRNREVPKRLRSRSASPVKLTGLPTLPSGLTIERVTTIKKLADKTKCNECSLPGNLQECETCNNGFHISCHNRILSQAPKKCPKCLQAKEQAAQILEKVKLKKELLEKSKNLSTELSKLQDKHSQLTISLKTQQTHREELLLTQKSTEDRIKKINDFICNVKGEKPPPSPVHSPKVQTQEDAVKTEDVEAVDEENGEKTEENVAENKVGTSEAQMSDNDVSAAADNDLVEITDDEVVEVPRNDVIEIPDSEVMEVSAPANDCDVQISESEVVQIPD